MSHPYTDRYPNSGPTSEQRISALEQRIAKLEAQLGAAPRVAATREDAGATTGDANGSAAAPSISAERSPAFWRTESSYHQRHNNSPNAADACNLAAAVTELWEKDRQSGGSWDSQRDLNRLISEFCRGENLPEVGG